MYWAGKDLARKFPLDSLEEVAEFLKKPLGVILAF